MCGAVGCSVERGPRSNGRVSKENIKSTHRLVASKSDCQQQDIRSIDGVIESGSRPLHLSSKNSRFRLKYYLIFKKY